MNPINFIKNLIKIIQAKPEVPDPLKNNELLNIILNRRSIRRFTDKIIPEEAFRAILEAGRLAPSTVNLQTWYFMEFTSLSWRKHFGRQMPFKGNRAVIILGDVNRINKIITNFPNCSLTYYTLAVMNASLAAMNMNIAAEALGVSSVMLSDTGKSGFFDAHYLKDKLSLPNGVFPLMTIVFGYAKSRYPPMPPKLPLDTIHTRSGFYQEADMKILQDWYDQMTAGFKASAPLSSFKSKLEYYRKNIEKAEKELHGLIYELTLKRA